MTEDTVAIRGHWVTLEPVGGGNSQEAARLERTRARTPNLGGAPGRRDVPKRYGPPMLIRENKGGTPIGLLDNGEMTGYPGVAVVLIFIDTSVSRGGTGVEAIGRYTSFVFEQGARLVHMEVLELNRPVVRMIEKVGLEPQARMREQVYAAGRFWDVLAFAFDRERWDGIRERYASLFAGGSRRPAALGGRHAPAG